MYFLHDSCCLSIISLSRNPHDFPDFYVFRVTRCACDVDQSANISICVSTVVITTIGLRAGCYVFAATPC